jgi:endonuclease/exonuclease/phosphatase (EEP) superfamily protein YafD
VKLWRIICIATAAEASAASAALGLLGLLGAFNGWLDVINQFAPIWLLVGLVGVLGAQVLEPSDRVRRGVLILSGVGAAIGLLQVGPDMLASIGQALRHEAKPPILKVVTFNVWSENFDPERTIQVILAAHPDVVAVQEGMGPFRSADAALLQALPYRISCPAGTDLAFYSRTAPTAGACTRAQPGGPPPATGYGPIWIRVRARDGREVTLATTHLVWPFPPENRLAQLTDDIAVLRQLEPANLILVGDFNSSPWTFTTRRQDALLRPLTRRSHGIATWPARITRLRMTIPTPFLAIDQVYAGPGLRSVHVGRLPVAGSDHYGLVASVYG